jgi:hypothetical protein
MSNYLFVLLRLFLYLVDLFVVGEYLEEYMVLNMKKGNGKVGRIEN